MSRDRSVRVLVTGFGPFQDITTNPSWEIARRLSSSIVGSNGEYLEIIVPPSATRVAYHKTLKDLPQLLEEHVPDLIVHIGLDVESAPGTFNVERSAPKEGYHDIPDEERKVFTRLDNRNTFGKASESLVTTLDIDAATELWQQSCSSLVLSTSAGPPHLGSRLKGKGKLQRGRPVVVQTSDDVGTYICGFQYYTTMLEMQKRTKKRDVVFLHVPQLEGEAQITIGVRVTEELIKALAAVRV
ncbi:hypothetical protein BKA63DRAFT_138725 [Paraphoma chrysanthemicola]|nr:hypothetical protein BKA63DRAFT_138725 [Paraphoma chrysanthemicola]